MADFSYVNIELPEASRLADLYGFVIDLNTCRLYCEKYIATFARGEDTECYWSYVFIKYGRCFKNGIRKPYEGTLPIVLSAEELDLHQLVLNLRDKHLAHSVNDLELHRVRVWLNPSELGRRVNSVNIESHYLAGPAPKLFHSLMGLIEKFIVWAEEEKKSEEAKLLSLVERKYDLDYLYSLEASAPGRIDYSRAAKRRKKP